VQHALQNPFVKGKQTSNKRKEENAATNAWRISMRTNDRFAEFLSNSHELESFCHDFISHVAKRRPKPGTDVTKYAEKLHLSVPAVLKGAKMTWDGPHDSEVAHKEGGRGQTLVFVRPGPADAVGLTIGCIRVGRFKICLECGWFYCRVVIKGRF
jgi:hypothetical protein